MLELKNITKKYIVGQNVTEALCGVSVNFRKSEFVSVLGPSGCGKTTLLNIIGGLDRFTSGDLIINGRSTKQYRDRDWDSYRNHSIGFVFQSYNLIPHQSVLSNVELALTLSGIKKKERRRRAIEALEKVGLGDQLHKKPNQMSGGQMQRVAIARAIVNDPDILLADEPTGALDTQTSVQVMEILKEIANDRLIIMVTHNPELAEKYSTRVIKLLDGEITDDSDPYTPPVEYAPVTDKKKRTKRAKHRSMSFFTALSLSFNNLLTKKARTFLTSFAGSIGIIGIALILSLSTGVNAYVDNVQRDTLSSYPLTINKTTSDMSDAFADMLSESQKEHDVEDGEIYVNNTMSDMIGMMFSGIKENDLRSLKKYIESDECDIDKYVSDIQYKYDTTLNVYNVTDDEKVVRANPSTVFEDLGVTMGSATSGGTTVSMGNTDIFTQLIGDDDFVRSQFDVHGHLPENRNEVVLMTGENNEVSDYTLYSIGMLDIEEIKKMMDEIRDGAKYESKTVSFTDDDFMDLTFKVLTDADYYEKQDDGTYTDMHEDEDFIKKQLENAEELKIVGILSPKENSTTTQKGGLIGYKPELMEHMVDMVNDSEIVKAQKADEKTDIFTGKPFKTDDEPELTDEQIIMSLDAAQQQYIATMSDADRKKLLDSIREKASSSATYEENIATLGVADVDEPAKILIYPVDFESKDEITKIIDEYNDGKSEEDQIKYTDIVGLMMSSITTIISAVSYILIAFVAISLIVSSIMIGIITYISVLERTKEIGVLRSIGASKKDISRVFNAETMIVGFCAGAIGILVTLLLLIPINIIITNLTDISGLAYLPWQGGAALVIISMLLTFIAGLIPARFAANKDPVVALRSE